MSRHKAYSLTPRDCLKTTLFQKWQRMVAPPGKRGTFFIQICVFNYYMMIDENKSDDPGMVLKCKK